MCLVFIWSGVWQCQLSYFVRSSCHAHFLATIFNSFLSPRNDLIWQYVNRRWERAVWSCCTASRGESNQSTTSMDTFMKVVDVDVDVDVDVCVDVDKNQTKLLCLWTHSWRCVWNVWIKILWVSIIKYHMDTFVWIWPKIPFPAHGSQQVEYYDALHMKHTWKISFTNCNY